MVRVDLGLVSSVLAFAVVMLGQAVRFVENVAVLHQSVASGTWEALLSNSYCVNSEKSQFTNITAQYRWHTTYLQTDLNLGI